MINLPIGILSLLAIHLYLNETSKVQNIRFDFSGAFLLTIGLGCLIYALTEGRENNFPFWFYLLVVFSLIAFNLFLRLQKTKFKNNTHPLINLSLFKLKDFKIGLLAVLFHFMLHTAYLLIIAIYLQNGLGVSALACGMYFVPHAILFMVSSIFAGKLLPQYGKHVLQLGLCIILLSFILQIFLFSNKDVPLVSIFFLALYGLGNGLVLPFLLNIVLNNISEKDAGAASGIFSTFQQTASALGISIIGGIFYAVLESYENSDNYLLALQVGLSTGILCLIIVLIMLYLLPNTSTNKQEPLHGIE